MVPYVLSTLSVPMLVITSLNSTLSVPVVAPELKLVGDIFCENT